jgi:hypothetical protein
MLNRLRNEASHVCGELLRGEHRAAWWVVLAGEALGLALLANLL